MKTSKELIDIFKKNNLEYYESRNDLEGINTIELSTTDINTVIKFAVNNSIDTVFYYINYIFEEMLCINDEAISELSLEDSIINILRPKFNTYNEKVKNLDFSKPFAIYVFCIFNGFLIFAGETDYWFIEDGFDLSENAAQQIVFDNQNEIFDIGKKNEDNRIQIRAELRKLLLNSEDFHKCTNRELRRAFKNRFFKQNENKKYRSAFYNNNNFPYDVTINTFIEEVWRDYKN